jgi:hypothetical protein
VIPTHTEILNHRAGRVLSPLLLHSTNINANRILTPQEHGKELSPWFSPAQTTGSGGGILTHKRNVSQSSAENRKRDISKYKTKYISPQWECKKDESEKCLLKVGFDVEGTATHLLLTCVEGRATGQAVSRWLPIAVARVQTWLWSCGILWWTKVALGQLYSENFGFPCQSTFHLLASPQSSSLSPETGTIDQEWPQCQ